MLFSFIFGCRMQTPHGALFPFGPSSVILPVSLSDVRQNAFNFIFFLSPPSLSTLRLLLCLNLFADFLCLSQFRFGLSLVTPALTSPYPSPPIPQAIRLSAAMSSNTQQKPLPFVYQFAAGAVAGVSEVCLSLISLISGLREEH